MIESRSDWDKFVTTERRTDGWYVILPDDGTELGPWDYRIDALRHSYNVFFVQ